MGRVPVPLKGTKPTIALALSEGTYICTTKKGNEKWKNGGASKGKEREEINSVNLDPSPLPPPSPPFAQQSGTGRYQIFKKPPILLTATLVLYEPKKPTTTHDARGRRVE